MLTDSELCSLFDIVELMFSDSNFGKVPSKSMLDVVVSLIVVESWTPSVTTVELDVDVDEIVVTSSSKYRFSLFDVLAEFSVTVFGVVRTISLYSLNNPLRLIIFSESDREGKSFAVVVDELVLTTVVEVHSLVLDVVEVDVFEVVETLLSSFPVIKGRLILRFLILSLLTSGLCGRSSSGRLLGVVNVLE